MMSNILSEGLPLGLFSFGRVNNSKLVLYDEDASLLVRNLKFHLELLKNRFGFGLLHEVSPFWALCR